MQKIYHNVALAAATAIVACTPVDLTSRKDYDPYGGFLDGPEEPDVPEAVPEFFVAGLEFAEDYDWRLDPDYGFSECFMFLAEQDGKRLTDFRVGYESQVSSDADMTRCVGGHVYTDFSTDSETIIKCDGTELFRYPGREMIYGLIEQEDGIYTLGVPREGSGWTYRHNGILLNSSDKGEVTRPPYEDDGTIAFSYEIAEYGHYGSRSCFIVEDGVAFQISPPSGCTLTDYMKCGGDDVLLLRKSGVSAPMLVRDGVQTVLRLGTGMISGNASFMESDGESAFIGGKVQYSDGSTRNVVWQETDLHTVFPADFVLERLYPDSGEFLAVGHRIARPSDTAIFLDGNVTAMDAGYVFSSRSCAAFSKGHYCICMNPELPGSAPFFIVDGERTTVEINGWLAGTDYELAFPSSQETDREESGFTEM